MTKPTSSPKPLRPSSMVTGIDGAHFSHTQASQTNYWGGISQEHKKIIVSSFTTSVQRNKFVTTKKQTILHITFKLTIFDVSESFQMHLRSDLAPDYSYKISLILQMKLRGYKYMDLPTKHQKAIPYKLLTSTRKQTPI